MSLSNLKRIRVCIPVIVWAAFECCFVERQIRKCSGVDKIFYAHQGAGSVVLTQVFLSLKIWVLGLLVLDFKVSAHAF